jgi:hypothetical protein
MMDDDQIHGDVIAKLWQVYSMSQLGYAWLHFISSFQVRINNCLVNNVVEQSSSWGC